MAKLPLIKQLVREDFADQGSWIEKLLVPLNQFMDSVSFPLNGQLTFRDNFAAETRVLDVRMPATVTLWVAFEGDGWPLLFPCSVTAPATLQVVRVVEPRGSSKTTTGAVYADWEPTGEYPFDEGRRPAAMKRVSGAQTGLPRLVEGRAPVNVGRKCSLDVFACGGFAPAQRRELEYALHVPAGQQAQQVS